MAKKVTKAKKKVVKPTTKEVKVEMKAPVEYTKMTPETKEVVEKIVEQPSIKIKLLNPKSIAPTVSVEGAYGWDLIATDLSVQHQQGPNAISHFRYNLGISVIIPKGFIGLLVPLKSLQETKMVLPHSMEVISSDSELTITFTGPKEAQNYPLGRKVAQLLVLPASNLGLKVV